LGDLPVNVKQGRVDGHDNNPGGIRLGKDFVLGGLAFRGHLQISTIQNSYSAGTLFEHNHPLQV
jgi:hypothetical protein